MNLLNFMAGSILRFVSFSLVFSTEFTFSLFLLLFSIFVSFILFQIKFKFKIKRDDGRTAQSGRDESDDRWLAIHCGTLAAATSAFQDHSIRPR